MRRHQNEGFHQVQFEIQDKQKKEDHYYAPSLMNMPNNAKSIMDKSQLDMSKPKVLIRQVGLYTEPPELLCDHVEQQMTQQKMPEALKQESQTKPTLFERYILSQEYSCIYHKYIKDKVQKFSVHDLKKVFNKQHFGSHFINLDFLGESSTFMMKNIQEGTFDRLSDKVYQVTFDSRFQCGNLYAVFKNREQERVYDLIIQNDINTKGYNNWFYFNIRSLKAQTIKLRIVNMIKQHTLYLRGMKPSVFSYKAFLNEGIGWRRYGKVISYTRTTVIREADVEGPTCYYMLQFDLDLKYQNDITFVALNQPYSYSRLLKFLRQMQGNSQKIKQLYFKREVLSKSLSMNECPLITITNRRLKEQVRRDKKKIVGIIARQHPIQTVGSYAMEGCIRYLLGGSEEATQLLNKYIFKIVPMMNVDGVIYGNSRCDISGSDINRQWSAPDKNLHPSVCATKQMFERLLAEGYQIQYFVDLHGHSKKFNSFIYGCRDPVTQNVDNRMLSYIMSKVEPIFSYENSIFGLNRTKRNTARANILRLMRFPRSITLQTSFFGYSELQQRKPFSSENIRHVGGSLIYSIWIETLKQNVQASSIQYDALQGEIKDKLKEQNIAKKEKANQQQNASSDSEPYIDELDFEQKQKAFISKSTIKHLRINARSLDPTIRNELDLMDEMEDIEPLKRTESNSDVLNVLTPRVPEIRIKVQNLQKKRSPTNQKLKITNPLPFAFSSRKSPRERKRTNGATSSQSRNKVIFTIEMPVRKDSKMLDRQALWQSLNPTDQGSFWSKFRKQMDKVISERIEKEPSSGTLPKYHSMHKLTKPFVLERKNRPERWKFMQRHDRKHPF